VKLVVVLNVKLVVVKMVMLALTPDSKHPCKSHF
jgi:hypothetical protein